MALREIRASWRRLRVLLRLRRDRRRRDRHAALDHPERPRAADARIARAHRGRRRGRAPTGRGRRTCAPISRSGSRPRRSSRARRPIEVATHGAAARRHGSAGRAHGRAARRAGRVSRSTARSSCEDGRAFSHALLANRGALVRPELLAQLGARGRRSAAHRRRSRSRSAASSRRSPGGASARSASARACSSTTTICGRPGCCRSAAAPTTRSC